MKYLKQLFESIEQDDKIDYMNGGYQMLAVFSRETLRRAEELEAPEQLRIIRPQELAPKWLSGLGRLVGKSALCFLIGKQDIIEKIKAPEDKM